MSGDAARVGALTLLGLLALPLTGFLGEGPSGAEIAVAVAGTALFALLSAAVIWRAVPPAHQGRGTLPLAAATAVAAALVGVMGHSWLLAASYYLVTLTLLDQPQRRWMPALVMIVGADVAVCLWVFGAGGQTVLSTAAQIGGFGLLVAGGYRIIQLSKEIKVAQAHAELAAVAEERLRIARDLHDILGQRLTEVVLKAELATRVVHEDLERATRELAELAEVARGALGDVRATVSDFRPITLSGELAAARTLMRSAGIELTVTLPDDPLPEVLDGLAAHAVREGVTNVLRHSTGRRCTITVTSGDQVVVTVRDDGRAVHPDHAGGGLRGLAERLEPVGGRLSAGPADGGFQMRVEVPGGSH
ncbi:histidine kinase [Spongiactinospora sp. TRM90649]|uniref:sensor histidine kinase n=1 Tax=Spongiactinospora sp. TRM90649 TaxID=3031114 RepID=UPI0023F6BE50|nr:histidine kinase [Spongiactinospora sp. TRM90649]MDF5756337.1 histidine kinase [Spongiactinospora sp. TRM90649]